MIDRQTDIRDKYCSLSLQSKSWTSEVTVVSLSHHILCSMYYVYVQAELTSVKDELLHEKEEKVSVVDDMETTIDTINNGYYQHDS